MKDDAIRVLGEEAAELIEQLEKLRRRGRTKSQTSGMVLKSDERRAALAKIKEMRKRLDEIERELTDGDFARKWGNQESERRVKLWDDGTPPPSRS